MIILASSVVATSKATIRCSLAESDWTCACGRVSATVTISQLPHAGQRYDLEIGERSYDRSTSSAYTTKQPSAFESCQGSKGRISHLMTLARKGLGISERQRTVSGSGIPR